MNEAAEAKVKELLGQDASGHGMDHIQRVRRMASAFARETGADEAVADLIALLHDADDYKLVGKEAAASLSNSRAILQACGVDTETAQKVLKGVSQIGYSKRLAGIVPESLEAKVVSDADMCDAMGATGILRAYTYSQKFNNPFFDPTAFPKEDVDLEAYTSICSNSTVHHLFDKILRLPSFMLTEAGKAEAAKRQAIQVEFLHHLFEEENAPQWSAFLDAFLKAHA